MSQRWLCERFRLTDKTETIIGKVNKRHIIKHIKMKVGMNRRRNEPAKHATKSRRVRIDGGR
jgi:hypothetical protein